MQKIALYCTCSPKVRDVELNAFLTKTKPQLSKQSKINLVEIRVIIQSLTQRVTELEEALDSKNKTITSLKKQMQDQSTIS